MKAIILAGGRGTRLYPISADRPKPMVQLLGLPLLEHIVELLRRGGFCDICMSLGYMADKITEYFGSGERFGVSIEYRVENYPLGTAGGVAACADFTCGEDFLVISGDAACDFDLRELYRRHRERGADLTMALYSHPEPLKYGTVLLSPEGRVRSFIEKPDWPRVVTDLVNTGIYIVSPQVTQLIPQGVFSDFAGDVFPEMQEQKMFMLGAQLPGYWCDIGSPEDYRRCCMDALSGELRLYRTAAGQWLENEGSFLCYGTKVDKSAILDSCVIHSGASIGADCRVTNSVIDGFVGEGCTVSGAVVCARSSVREGETVPAGSVLSPYPEKPAKQPGEAPRPLGGAGLGRELACAGRASLMHRLSDYLWEAGADYTDGISLRDGRCEVRIRPLAGESAIAVEASGGSSRERSAACSRYFELAKKLEREKYSF